MNAIGDASPERLRLRIKDYLLLNEAGASAAADRTELIDGEILILSPRFRREALARMIVATAIEQAALYAIGFPTPRVTNKSTAHRSGPPLYW